MNVVHILGNLGADPELRVTAGGTAVLKLRVATTERAKKGENWEDHTEWHSATAFGKRAEGLAKFLTKGSKVAITGKLRTSSYEKDGQKIYRTEIIADDVEPCGGKGGGKKQDDDDAPASGLGDPNDSFGGGGSDDSIPF